MKQLQNTTNEKIEELNRTISNMRTDIINQEVFINLFYIIYQILFNSFKNLQNEFHNQIAKLIREHKEHLENNEVNIFMKSLILIIIKIN